MWRGSFRQFCEAALLQTALIRRNGVNLKSAPAPSRPAADSKQSSKAAALRTHAQD
jgi:hypothetical protein